MWLIYYSIKKPASSSSEACLLPKEFRATKLHDERLSSYFGVVHYLLRTYSTDDVIVHAMKELESFKQGSGVFAALYAERLYTKALHCIIVYGE